MTSGVTVNIDTILETIEQLYGDGNELVFTCHDYCWIEDSAGEQVVEFDTRDQLYKWCVEQQEILDERRKEAYRRQGYIEY